MIFSEENAFYFCSILGMIGIITILEHSSRSQIPKLAEFLMLALWVGSTMFVYFAIAIMSS